MSDLLAITDWAALLGIIALAAAGAMYFAGGADGGAPSEAADRIRAGAFAFLKRQSLVLLLLLAIGSGLVFWAVGLETAVAFACGGVGALLVAFCGALVTARSAVRVSVASPEPGRALAAAFSGGALLGLAVTALGLVVLGVYYWIFASAAVPGTDELPRFASFIGGIAAGASWSALFIRLGGGIFGKSADVGADTLAKVESELPEDDPRNPAALADVIGDTLGVAGLGAQLFETTVAAVVATMVIGATSAGFVANPAPAVAFPLLAVMVGLLASLVGVAAMKALAGGGGAAVRIVTYLAAGFFLLVMFFVSGALDLQMVGMAGRALPSWGPWAAIAVGTGAGLFVGVVSEYYTLAAPLRRIADGGRSGTSTALITGLAVGMESTVASAVLLSIATLAAYLMAGFYGIGVAALGMMATVALTTAVAALHPTLDAAAAQQREGGTLGLGDSLAGAANSAAAITRGLLNGANALTGVALFSAFASTIGLTLTGLDLVDPAVVVTVLLGGALPFLVAGLTIGGVGRGAARIVEEGRRQLLEIPGILERRSAPDAARCVEIASRAGLREMILPGVVAVLAPVLVGFLLGVAALGGLLVGTTVTGVLLAFFMGSAGGAWDSAKTFVEGGAHGGKGSPAHRAVVVADAVGDPLKDVAGPAVGILVRVMGAVALVIAPWLLRVHGQAPEAPSLSWFADALQRLLG